MAEKRDLKRHRKRLSVRFGVGNTDRLAFTEDISTQGLFIKTANVCPPGTRIRIDLALPDERTVQMEAQVRWAKKVPPQMMRMVQKSGMGVRIIRFLAGEDLYAALCEELHSR